MFELTIDREMWLRGEGASRSKLLRHSDGKMCCLGFLCLAAGTRAKAIRGVAQPDLLFLEELERDELRWLTDDETCSQDCIDAMEVNDDDSIEEPEREAAITEILARHGIHATFVGPERSEP